jgi:hypothetical protein
VPAQIHTRLNECFVRNENGILRKFARFRIVTRKHGSGAGLSLAKKEEGNRKRSSLYRYRDSPEEIQEEY